MVHMRLNGMGFRASGLEFRVWGEGTEEEVTGNYHIAPFWRRSFSNRGAPFKLLGVPLRLQCFGVYEACPRLYRPYKP